MDPSRYAQVKAIFVAAQAVAPEQLDGFLEEACGADRALHEEVASLLGHVHTRPLSAALGGDCLDVRPEDLKPPELDDDDVAPGTAVGAYVVEAEIGRGNFGRVYRGRAKDGGDPVAIKVLRKRFCADAGVVSRFAAEARAAQRIAHAGIVDIFSFDRLPNGRHFFVMELVEGRPLSERLKAQGALPLAEALPILGPVAEALQATAEAGITHRDLKPANILVARDAEGRPRPKLLDFGVAKLLDDTIPRNHRTNTGAALGTPAYMAPEQCMGHAVDHRADIYAFGVVCFEVLTGRLPFEAKGTFDMMALHVRAPAPALRALRSEIPEGVDRAVRAMLEKAPEARPGTIAAAWAAVVAGSRVAELRTTLRRATREPSGGLGS